MVFVFQDPWVFFLPLIVFLVVLYTTKIVAISSILSSIVSTLYIVVINNIVLINVATVIITVILIYRHRTNIKRMMDGCENKITWI